MYDMYPSDWPSAPVAVAVAERATEPETPQKPQKPQKPQAPQASQTSAIRAVQIALDRRDNGGAAADRAHQ